MSVYQVDLLLQVTRRIPAAYYQTTNQVLPVGNEIAKRDLCRLLNLTPVSGSMQGVDAYVIGKFNALGQSCWFRDGVA